MKDQIRKALFAENLVPFEFNGLQLKVKEPSIGVADSLGDDAESVATFILDYIFTDEGERVFDDVADVKRLGVSMCANLLKTAIAAYNGEEGNE